MCVQADAIAYGHSTGHVQGAAIGHVLQLARTTLSQPARSQQLKHSATSLQPVLFGLRYVRR